jgi:hypothetical protein
MMKIFISGSISFKSLDLKVINCLDSIIASGQTVLIGDAFGVDKLVQQYLFVHNYQSVVVYYAGNRIRNNIGHWPTKRIGNDDNLTGKSMYQLKDAAMAQDADCGLMIWNGKSNGTKYNIEKMSELGKEYIVLIFPTPTDGAVLYQSGLCTLPPAPVGDGSNPCDFSYPQHQRSGTDDDSPIRKMQRNDLKHFAAYGINFKLSSLQVSRSVNTMFSNLLLSSGKYSSKNLD